MRIVFAVFAAMLVFDAATVPARAEAPVAKGVEAVKIASEAKAERLNQLFSDLKRERNEKAALRISERIWREWFHSGSDSIDLMMQWAQEAIEKRKFDVALDFLDQVTTLRPLYAEGWNRRATVHFMMKNYAKSMADIDHTLQLEPRHFGALSGLAQIMMDTGRKETALKAWQNVLKIYPMLRNAQNQVTAISEELTGERI